MPREGHNGWIRSRILDKNTSGADLTANTALTIMTGYRPGFRCFIEEFGFVVDEALAGAGGTLTFTLTDGSDNVIATLTITLAAGADGAVITTSTITETFREVRDPTTLKLKRSATGTAFTSGSGNFYVKARQRPQQVA